MDEKELKELEDYTKYMADFAKKQEELLKGIQQRFNSVYEHEKKAARLTYSAKRILNHFDLAEKEEMLQQAIELKSFIISQFNLIIEEEIQMMRQDSQLILQDGVYINQEQRIFATNYLELNKIISERTLKSTEAVKKLKKEADYIKGLIQKQKKGQKLNEFLAEKIRQSKTIVNDIKDLVLDELETLDNFIFKEKYVPSQQKLKASILKLDHITNKLKKLLRKEKSEILDPLKKILQDKENMIQEVTVNFLQNKGVITLDTIKNDLRKLTTKPNEVREYAFVIMRYKDYFDQNSVGKIEDYLERVQKWSEIATKKEEATEDELTQVGSRKKLKQDLDREIARAKRTENVFSIAMIDIDHFKEFNDTYGHQTGDRVLQFIAGIMKRIARVGSDESYRYGGEEFIMLYTDTDKQGAKKAAERLRQAVENESRKIMQNINLDPRLEIQEGKERRDGITVSIGVATYLADGNNADELIKKADDALYYSKNHGRNKVIAAGEHEAVLREQTVK